jgi:hypothetical protein
MSSNTILLIIDYVYLPHPSLQSKYRDHTGNDNNSCSERSGSYNFNLEYYSEKHHYKHLAAVADRGRFADSC